jgi:hypothetical protein
VWLGRRPATFNGKVRWRMLKDRRPILTTIVDKVAVREHVTRLVGPEYLTVCHAVVDDPRDLHSTLLPREFVAKASHASGGTWLVTDRAPSSDFVNRGVPFSGGAQGPVSGWNRIVTSPERLDLDLLVATYRVWLSRRYEDVPEWAYQNVTPRILVEELLSGPGGGVPDDYKFFVAGGAVRLVQVDSGRFGSHRRNLYLSDWTRLDAEFAYPCSDEESSRPSSLEQMVELAEVLGRGWDFIRVDLYDIDGRVVFGELTPYPEGGCGWFRPDSYDAELGRHWKLPSRSALHGSAETR